MPEMQQANLVGRLRHEHFQREYKPSFSRAGNHAFGRNMISSRTIIDTLESCVKNNTTYFNEKQKYGLQCLNVQSFTYFHELMY